MITKAHYLAGTRSDTDWQVDWRAVSVCCYWCIDCDDVADTSVCCILLDDCESVVEIIDDPQSAHQVTPPLASINPLIIQLY